MLKLKPAAHTISHFLGILSFLPSSRDFLVQPSCSVFSSELRSSVGSCTSRSESGADTPVRKISSQEFEAVASRPLLATNSDGSLTFITGASPPALTDSLAVCSKLRPPRRLSQVRGLDERELMQELILDICHDLDTTSLCHKILQNVCLLLGADRCSLFLIDRDRESGERHLVSKLFDVTSESTVEESVHRAELGRIRLRWGSGIMGTVAASGEALNIPDVYQVRAGCTE